MAFNIDCPRCKQNLLVPRKKTGSYANCPRCGGRFWVPVDHSADPSATDAGSDSSAMIVLRPAPVPPLAQPPGQPPLPPVSGRKVARFISAETAQSILKPAAYGRLPDLQLSEGQQQDAAESRSRSIHPLVLFGLLTLSVVISVVLALVDVGAPSSSTTSSSAPNLLTCGS